MKRIFMKLMIASFVAISTVLLVNSYMLKFSEAYIFTQLTEAPEMYTAVVLGARVYSDGQLSSYLKDRVDGALALYEDGKTKKFLLSGDHGTKTYDEVNHMKAYLVEKGVPERDIFLDHAGFNTYNSMVRALKIFKVEECIVVSQDYHLPRAVFIARKNGIDAYGYAQSSSHLASSKFNKKREVLARFKSFGEVLLGLSPTYLGDEIPITGDSYLSYD